MEPWLALLVSVQRPVAAGRHPRGYATTTCAPTSTVGRLRGRRRGRRGRRRRRGGRRGLRRRGGRGARRRARPRGRRLDLVGLGRGGGVVLDQGQLRCGRVDLLSPSIRPPAA